MDDLIPFLVFIVIALINFVKFLMERGAKEKRPPVEGEETPRPAATLDEIFEGLTRKLDPNNTPTDLPEWPEGYEQPDYAAEQAAYEEYQEPEIPEPVFQEPEPARAEIIPMPVAEERIPSEMEVGAVQTASLKSALKSVPAIKSSFTTSPFPSTPIMKSGNSGSIRFSMKNKNELRQAILAKVVFDPPRAFDASFENTARR